MFLQYIFTLDLFLIGVSILSAAFQVLLLGNAITNDLRSYLIEINKNTKLKKNHFHATEQFLDFIRIHTLAKQLSEIVSSSKKN